MREPLEVADSIKYQQSAKGVDVQELLESSNSSTEGEEEDNSDPEWLKQDPKNQEVWEVDNSTENDSKGEEEVIVVKATMPSTPTVRPQVPALAPATTIPPTADANVMKEKDGKDKG